MPTLQDDVEDLVQETLLAVHLQRGTYDPTFAVSAWFTTIARHKLVDLWRRRGRQDELDLMNTRMLMSRNWLRNRRTTTRYVIWSGCCRSCPFCSVRPLRLTKLEGLSITEASTRTGVSESAIRCRCTGD